MANLPAIIRATRASYHATQAMARHSRAVRDAFRAGDVPACKRAERLLAMAESRFDRAQAILNLNPLPGDNT